MFFKTKLNIKFIIFSLIIGSVFSCKKAEDRKCWKRAGNEDIKIVYLNNFPQLLLKKGIHYELIQDSLNQIEIIGGKNLIQFIDIQETESNSISISNNNKCNFLRKYEKNIIKVKIHFTQLSYIRYEGTENLINKDTLHFQDFKFESIDACGSSHLILKANNLEALAPMGNSNFTFSGEVENLKLDIRDYSYCNTLFLKVKNNLNVINESFNDVYINADQNQLTGKIIGAGNVYYKGNLLSNELKIFGSGKLIKLSP
ncbi:MAG: DUF2807 domain-containing protein [Flavobacteriia bacterium]|nr:DUF2807 domain-containing protein [Flavobacteriia bacterium]